MDAALAGLVGALGGGVIGAAGAWGAALIAFRAARYQADTQAKSSHEQWLRQVRRDVYVAFLIKARRALDGPFQEALDRDQTIGFVGIESGELGTLIAQCSAAYDEIEEAEAAMALEAPPELVRTARNFMEALYLLVHELRLIELSPGNADIAQVGAYSSRAFECFKEAMAICRASLQD
ncbi:hypothetical protein [Streptomyces sp. SID12488]|uniref:hypothetical protein n=1 Tax=Streptomyces sp. SID12488 TaxID=2706040 RepID=UPI0013DBB9F8|nr:hypothetical protein [Streptomyces sp. SID12488]NEA65369.1 hypothetical protein [Streptomyces sp. SID12488]